MLPRKCESSMTPSGTTSASACMRPAMVGDAPVASSMIPATNTIRANRLGARMSAQEPTRLGSSPVARS